MLYLNSRKEDPVLSCRLHADLPAVVLGKPGSQVVQALGEGGETSLLVLGATVGVGDSDAGIDPGLVDVETAAVFTKDLKSQFEPPQRRNWGLNRDWPSGKIESIWKR